MWPSSTILPHSDDSKYYVPTKPETLNATLLTVYKKCCFITTAIANFRISVPLGPEAIGILVTTSAERLQKQLVIPPSNLMENFCDC